MEKDFERESSQIFNMGLAHLQRIDALLNQYVVMRNMAHPIIIIRLLERIMEQLYPFLNDSERKYALEQCRALKGLVNPTEHIMYFNFGPIDEFNRWLMVKLNEKSMLMPKQDDLGEILR